MHITDLPLFIHIISSHCQITVRSSPIVLDKLAVCRHCHKNCQQAALGLQQSISPAMSTSQTQRSAIGAMITEDSVGGGSGSGLVCTSLKVQHSQSSPNRCCRLNGTVSQAGSTTSISSSTITGEQPSERSSKVVASSSKRETGDTESDVAQLITDDLSQSEATDDSIGGIPSSSSGVAGADEIQRRLTDSFSKLRILDERREAKGLDAKTGPQPMPRMQDQHSHQMVLMNGHCLSSSPSGDKDNEQKAASDKKPQPHPRTYRVKLQTATKEMAKEAADKKAKTTVTMSETAQIIRTQEQDRMQEKGRAYFVDTSRTTTKIPKSPHMPVMLKSPKSPGTPASASRFIACNCQCTPADFKNTTLSPDEVEQQTCKLIDSPKQSPQMPRQRQLQESAYNVISEKTYKHCKCICGGESLVTAGDEHSSFQFNGLLARQIATKTVPITPLPTPTSPSAPAPAPVSICDGTFVPTIAVVPPTPEAVLTMTSTNVWDNSGTNVTTSTTQLQLNDTSHQAVIENIPEDSCDESPLDEEPPYRPMSNALRRYGTMSSLEKLPSDDRVDDEIDEIDELDNDDDKSEVPGDTEDDDDLDDKARADTVDNMCETSKSSVYSNEVVAGGSCVLVGGVWTSRTSGLVGGNKMSFFEESRAFIDKYLGRWNQDQTTSSPAATTSETDEQADECTSGATSGEEVWGTPTSGGDNDDMHLVNSENTYSVRKKQKWMTQY